MKKILIDRSTIKLNPRAGETSYYADGITTITFSIECNPIPEFVFEYPFFVEQTEETNGVFTRASGIIARATIEEMELWSQVPGFEITVKNDRQLITHRPEPQYLYKYIKTYLKCSQCGADVEVGDIEIDYIGEDEIMELSCPYCGVGNTFEDYEYENISEVMAD